MDNPEETTPDDTGGDPQFLADRRTINDFRESLGLPRIDESLGETVFDTGWTGVVGATVTDGEVELHGTIGVPRWRVVGEELTRLSDAETERAAVETYLELGIITADEAESERIKIGEKYPAQPGDDDYVEPIEREPVQAAAHELGRVAADNGWAGSITLEADGDEIAITSSLRGPMTQRTRAVLDAAQRGFAEPDLYAVGTKVIFRNVVGEVVTAEIVHAYPEDPMTYRLVGDDGRQYGCSPEHIITPLFTGRAAMMHFDAEGGLAETIDVPAEDMRLVDEQWVVCIEGSNGHPDSFLPPDVLELPGDEFEAV